jgi:hypothetical protein
MGKKKNQFVLSEGEENVGPRSLELDAFLEKARVDHLENEDPYLMN